MNEYLKCVGKSLDVLLSQISNLNAKIVEDSEELMASKADADANREKLHSRVSYTNVVFLCAVVQ